MMNALQPRVMGLAPWLAAFAALCAVIGWETGWGQRVTSSPDGAQATPQPVGVSLLPEYTIEGGVAARRETVERPAFVPTRRPAPVPAQEPPKPKMARGQFTLTGTAVVDQKQIAFLRENAGGKARSVRAGETINGLTVTEVRVDRVKLTQGDESEELLLKVAAGPRTTIQPPQPGQPGVPVQPPRPVVGAPPPVAGTPAPMDSDASILERRRAARAAQAAAQEAAARGDQAAPQVPPGALAIPQPTQAPGAAPAAASNTAPDPRWQDVYRRMQQPRR